MSNQWIFRNYLTSFYHYFLDATSAFAFFASDASGVVVVLTNTSRFTYITCVNN